MEATRIPASDRVDVTDFPGGSDTAAVRTENVFVRNYDSSTTYDLAITVEDGGGQTRYEESYTVRPGQIESVCGVLPSGLYDVTVELGKLREKTRQCTVTQKPKHTIHVEVGNGILSLTEGLYG